MLGGGCGAPSEGGSLPPVQGRAYAVYSDLVPEWYAFRDA
jgi:hypothetical protein